MWEVHAPPHLFSGKKMETNLKNLLCDLIGDKLYCRLLELHQDPFSRIFRDTFRIGSTTGLYCYLLGTSHAPFFSSCPLVEILDLPLIGQ